MKDLENLTLKMLKTSDSFTSNDFIKSYNIIYLHCTEKTQSYEIKGALIYDLLKKVLSEYFKSLRPISSLQGFFLLNIKLEKSFILINRVYYYLERFYINCNIKKRGSNVVHLNTLFYNLLYNNFMYSRITNIEEYFIYEIETLRKSNKLENMEELKKSVTFLKDLFFYSENLEEYEKFLEIYFKSFKICKDDDIEKLISKTNRELEIAKELFESSDREFYSEIVKLISKNFKKLLNWFFNNKKIPREQNLKSNDINSVNTKNHVVNNNEQNKVDNSNVTNYTRFYANNTKFIENYKKIENILFYMEENYISIFFKKLELHILTHLEFLKDPEKIFKFFLLFFENFKFKNLKIDTFQLNIEKKIVELLSNTENLPNYFSNWINQKEDFDEQLNYTFYLINKLNQKNLIINKLCHDCLERIINDTTKIDQELQLFRVCEIYCGSSSVSWLILILQNYNSPIEQSFGLSGQNENFLTELRLITKGFCNIEINSINLHPKLSALQDILVKRFYLKFPRSEISCSFRASFIIFEFLGINFRLSADKVSLLMYFSEENLIKKVKNLSKDPNFEENIDFLEKHGFIRRETNKIFINSDLEILKDKCKILNKKIKNEEEFDSIDLFDYKIQDEVKLDSEINNNSLVEFAVDSQIMKFMKKHKKSTIKEISGSLDFEDSDLRGILQRLMSKGYLHMKNNNIEYIP
ncbi:uncharacterized protein VNE69_02124 [Vairimorpha necatrix]|uniref:Cullin family profile domain-containing protein n=1 Tax=Vairimorpha necatrix TaxID=6039 RepID=A0AAX4J9G8_9MICR